VCVRERERYEDNYDSQTHDNDKEIKRLNDDSTLDKNCNVPFK